MTFQGVTLDLEGESGPVRARIHRMPVISRAAGEGYRYASREFGSEFLEAVISGMPQADRGGMPWSRQTSCASCASEIDSVPSEAEFSVAIRLEALPEFDVAIRMPALTCARCGTTQMPPSRELDFHRTEALLQAFKAGQVNPG